MEEFLVLTRNARITLQKCLGLGKRKWQSTLRSELVARFPFFGSGFIMVTYMVMPGVRTFSFQIVFCLCLCDFMSSAAGIWGLHFEHSDPENPTPRCFAAAIFWQFFDIG